MGFHERFDTIPTRTGTGRSRFPSKFITHDVAPRWLTFKVQVPADTVARLESVKPGDWVTATSRHRPSSESETITSMTAYSASRSYPLTNEPREKDSPAAHAAIIWRDLSA